MDFRGPGNRSFSMHMNTAWIWKDLFRRLENCFGQTAKGATRASPMTGTSYRSGDQLFDHLTTELAELLEATGVVERQFVVVQAEQS